jgi:hypothetical protein
VWKPLAVLQQSILEEWIGGYTNGSASGEITIMINKNIKMGLGLIGIGREWGHTAIHVPVEAHAIRFLKGAYELGIEFFGKSYMALCFQGQSRLNICGKISMPFGRLWKL